MTRTQKFNVLRGRVPKAKAVPRRPTDRATVLSWSRRSRPLHPQPAQFYSDLWTPRRMLLRGGQESDGMQGENESAFQILAEALVRDAPLTQGCRLHSQELTLLVKSPSKTILALEPSSWRYSKMSRHKARIASLLVLRGTIGLRSSDPGKANEGVSRFEFLPAQSQQRAFALYWQTSPLRHSSWHAIPQ